MTWSNEIEFSNWLHGHIDHLGRVLALDLVADRREAPVGRLSADLLARVRSSGEAVIIENQVHTADHGHFGQVLTYAGHYDANVIVWISTGFREEYRAAFAWLNSLSAKRFYAVELGPRGADGTPAFTLVAGPSGASNISAAVAPQVVSVSADATPGAAGGWHSPALFAIRASRDASPGQLALNAIFELIATRLSSLRAFPNLKAPTGDRNYFVVANGPIRKSEWSVVFTNDRIRIELVFNDAATSIADVERMQARRDDLRATLGIDLEFAVVAGQAKQKAIVARSLTAEQRNQAPEAVAAWCADTMVAFANAVARLAIFSAPRPRETT
jgi:hypothetical protein|nr:hypothetical protein [Kofleriaceae bacterium]